MNGQTDFAKMVQSFLLDYLPHQRNYSPNTIESYKDALKLFTRFIVTEKGMKLEKFRLKDFTRDIVVEFIKHLEKTCSPSTANSRLAALKSFAAYCQIEEIEYISSLQTVASIKAVKQPERTIMFLDKESVSKLINAPDTRNHAGLRHRVTLCLLYDTGARVQELCDITLKDIHISDSHPYVHLYGKGRKNRNVPISNELASLLKLYIEREFGKRALQDEWFIKNRSRLKISPDGVTYILKKYYRQVFPDSKDNIFCHMLRHSKASHMLAAGIPIVYIRDFLGHENIETTMIYAKADIELKAKAINELAPKLVPESDLSLPDWRKDQDLMSFLESF